MGAAVLDVVMRVPRMPGADEKLKATAAHTAGGGNALNAAVAAARLLGTHGTATLVCALGADALATAVLAECRAEHVDVRATLLPHTATPLSLVLAADATKSFALPPSPLSVFLACCCLLSNAHVPPPPAPPDGRLWA